MSEIKPCPFCGAKMQDVSPGWWTHPEVDGCWFSKWEFDGLAASKWNQRDESALAQARAEERERICQLPNEAQMEVWRELGVVGPRRAAGIMLLLVGLASDDTYERATK